MSVLESKRSQGTYYVGKATTKTGWRVLQDYYVKGNRKTRTVKKEVWSTIGISSKMNIEQARERISQVNKKNSLKKAERAATRVHTKKYVDSVFLPKPQVDSFYKHLSESHFGSSAHEKRLMSQWETVQLLVKHLKMDVDEFYDRRNSVYKYFIKKKLSLDYSNKLLRILNMWGSFVSKTRNQHYEPVPSPKGIQRQQIAEAYGDSKTYRGGGAHPLSRKLLLDLKGKLDHLEGQYEWVHLSLWFGLRPSEVDALKDSKNYRIEDNINPRIKVLWVYQSKLSAVSKEKRWKPIPILFKEQLEALDYIESKNFKKPMNKTLKNATGLTDVGSYSGRKGFTDLMLSLEQDLEDISVWLGHATIDMTWKHYKNKNKINFNKTSKVIKSA